MKRDTIAPDRYALTPMQHALLLESFSAPESGVNIEQIIGRLREEIQLDHFKTAWERVIARHAVLRTSFHAIEESAPYQQVNPVMPLAVETADWSGSSHDEQEEKLRAYLEQDRRRGFRAAPWMRAALFRLGPADHYLVWTVHHALLDGRSFVIVLRDLFEYYERCIEQRDAEIEPAPGFREHVEWLQRHDMEQSGAFWRDWLRDLAAPSASHIPPAKAGAEPGRGIHTGRLGKATVSRLRAMAEREGVTLNTLVQGAWALLLSRYSQETDILFGVVRACRKSGTAAAERTVGLFMNTLPFRVRVEEEQKLSTWLKGLRRQQLAMRQFEHTPLVRIQQWTGHHRSGPLFQSILVFENRRLDEQLRALGGKWRAREFRFQEQTSFPLTLYAYGGDELTLELAFDRRQFDSASVARAVGHLEVLLGAMPDHADAMVSAIPLLTEPERRRLLWDWNRTARMIPLGICIHQAFEAQAGARRPVGPGVKAISV